MRTTFYRPGKEVQLEMTLGQKFGIIFAVFASLILLIGSTGVFAIRWFSGWSEKYYIAKQEFKMEVTMPKVWVAQKEPQIIYLAVVSSTSNPSVNLTEEQKKEVIAKSGYGKILSGVRMLESTNNSQANPTAHHVDCDKVGSTNEFGYGALNDTCFGSFEESVQTVANWFDRELQTKTLNQSLCYYNTGTALDVCTYAKNFASLDLIAVK